MSTTYRGSDVPTATRRDYWQHVAVTALGPIDLHVTGKIDVDDEFVVGELGAVRVGRLRACQPGGAKRTAKHIRQGETDYYKIDILAEGDGVVMQDGRAARLRPGDFTLIDLSRPTHWRMSAMCIVAVSFPRNLLPLSTDDIARLTAVTICGDRGTGALISSLALALPSHLDEPDAVSGSRLGTAVLDLLLAGMAAHLDRGDVVPLATRQRALLLRIRVAIEQRLGDPFLSPAELAAAHHISLRYLHKLFQSDQTTVAAWIRSRRLERCRRDLLDPAQMNIPVSTIAARWGLLNATHFSRAFRTAYGISPTDYRRANQPCDDHPAGNTSS